VASSLVSTLAFRRTKSEPAPGGGTMTDDDYLSWGKTSNQTDAASPDNASLFRLLEEEEGFELLFDVPFGLKHVRDVHVVMKHAVAVAGERREDLTRSPLFHPAFAAFALGFAIGLAQAHRLKHLGFRASVMRMSKRQSEQVEGWGVEIATYYLATVDADGIFGKDSDRDLYGIGDRWRYVADERRLDPFEDLKQTVEAGKAAAHRWFEDEEADVPPLFLEALAEFVEAHPGRAFD
jgi:hypothetical protein